MNLNKIAYICNVIGKAIVIHLVVYEKFTLAKENEKAISLMIQMIFLDKFPITAMTTDCNM